MAPVSLDDTIINKTNVNIARCQRLIASWLPPPSPHDHQHSKTEADLEEEDNRTFVPEPEVLGLGQAPSKDGVGPTESISNDTKLRRQLLGRDYDKKRKREAMGGKKGGAIGSKPLPQQRQVDRNEESEEEAGRSALGKSKCKLPKFNGKVMNHATDGVDDTGDERLDRVSPEVTSSKRPPNGNFLDHLLAEKERKRKRKNRKKKRIAADKPVQA